MAVDHALKSWHEKRMAAGGSVDQYAAQQSQQSQKAADIQAYRQGKLGADDLLKYFPGLTATMVEAQLEPQEMAKGGEVVDPKKALELIQNFLGKDLSQPIMKFMKGGEVKMQMGGNPADIQAQLAAGVPVHMSRGPEGTIARGLVEQQEAERRRKAAEQAAKVQGLPLPERLKGMYEAGRTVQSAIGQEIAKPFVGLIGGESKIKELEEGMPIPETEAGRYYLEKTGEFLEPIGKAFEASKIPDVPFMPEVGISYVPGIGRQIAGAAKRAGQKVEEIVPEGLKDLPVGLSTKSVGPEGEKVSINELIRRLEAGEEMTPEQRQKAEYSKAQKEKYAAANVARAQREPAPKEEEVRVPATEQGFFSSVEKAAANLKREEGSGEAFLSDIMKFNPSKGELEATGIADWLKGQKNLTKQDVLDYINNNQIQIEEVVRGRSLSKEDQRRFDDMNRKISQGYGHFLSPEEEEWFEATAAKMGESKAPRFEDERLILPGGENYKELLLKFPMREGAYKSSHWPDDPNTFAHVRMQDMDIGGKRTLMIEEIQSDWHQQGRTKGYRTNDADKAEKDFKSYSAELASKYDLNPEQNLSMYATIKRMLPEEVEKYESLQSAWVNSKDSVPDAPFKKDWYQLAIKRIMKYAADNDYDQVALVGPEEQIRRGSLDTYVDGLSFQKNKDGTIKLDAEKNGSIVLNKTVNPEDLELNVGKDVAKRILESKETDGTLTGDDLKIGGEGMRQYYERNYPGYFEKQYNKYGINLRKKELKTRGFDVDDVEAEGTGEVDRFGRETMGYTVRDPESGDVVGYGSSMEEALAEANKGLPKTDIWVMDLPAKLKSDVKIGQSYKKGGLVRDEKLKAWHEQQMAGGGIAKVTKAISKAGEKAAKRMSREEAEKAGYWHPISETKLAKPIQEYKSVVVEDPGAKMLPKKSLTIEELQGGVAIPLAGDRAAAGRIIKEIEGAPMDVRLEGGPDFMRLHPGAAWASGKGVLSMLADRIRMARESGQPIYGVYTAMSPQAVDFNTMMTESLLNQLDLSGLRKKDIKDFNEAVKSVKGQGGKPKAPNFPGVDDPELREKLIEGPGGQRDAFVKAMSKAEFQKKGFPDVAAARLAVTEPELLNVPRGSAGYTIAKLDPAAQIVEKSGHTTYPLDILGEYAGGLEKQLPVEVMYPSHFEAKRLLGSTPVGAHKSLELFAPLQYLDQEWLDNAMKYLEFQKKLTGRKKGGLAVIRN